MMLRSRARLLSFCSQRIPQALICSAGLALAGCGGRFLESPSALTRSAAATSPDDIPGSSSVEDAAPETSGGARGFLASLFRRDASQPNGWSRDPFLETPAVAQADTPDASRGVARVPDGEAERGAVTTERPRQIVRPPRNIDPAARQALDEAVARIAAPESPPQTDLVPDHQLPAWATGSRQIAAQAQRPQQDDPWQQSPAPASEGRVRISRLATETLPGRTAEPAPTPSRRVESLLAAAQENTRPVDPPAARPAPPVVAQLPDETRQAVAPPQPRPVPQPQTAPESQTAPQPQPQHLVSRPVRNLENPFENLVAATPPPTTTSRRAPASAAREMPSIPAAAPTNDEPIRELANRGGTAVPQLVEDSPWAQDPHSASPFPVLHEWRGVRANAGLALADPDEAGFGAGSDHDAEIHQTGFEETSGREQFASSESTSALLSGGLAMTEQDRLRPFRADVNIAAGPAPGIVTVPPPPPIEASTGIRVFPDGSIEPEETGSRIGWMIALLIATGLGVLVYRRRLRHGDS